MTRFVACDTETTMIEDRKQLRQKSSIINLSPYVVPKLILGTWCTEDGLNGLDRQDAFCARVRQWLQTPDVHLVFHHAPFDLRVLLKHDPTLRVYIEGALSEGRIHDTKVMDILIRLRDGYFDMPVFPQYETPQVVPRSLKELALEYARMELSKDDEVRLHFDRYADPAVPLPSEFFEYAIRDAIATMAVWQSMLRQLHPGAEMETYLSEPRQVRCDYAASYLDEKGVRIDQDEARRLRDIFVKDLDPLHLRLVAAGLGEWLPLVEGRLQVEDRPELVPSIWTYHEGWMYRRTVYKTKGRDPKTIRAIPVFHLSTIELRRRLENVPVTGFKKLPRTPTGLISLDAEWWKDNIPADDDGLHAWLELEKLRKILGTYLDLYAQVSHIYPKWKTLGARSGRWSCSSPNVQNIPKRKHGIRSLFVAEPGTTYVRADYSCQELLTLAQAMKDMNIVGPLLAGIQKGADLHKQTASLLLRIPESEVTKDARQTAKAVNFGVPGGLGPTKLADYAKKEYGIAWTPLQAKQVRLDFLKAYPDIRAYLERLQFSFAEALETLTHRSVAWWARDLGCQNDAWSVKEALFKSDNVALQELVEKVQRQITVRLRTGFVRSRCTFTEGANTGFQGLAAAVTKEAVFLARVYNLDVRLVVHDEIVIQSRPENVVQDSQTLEFCMKTAFCSVCPDTGPFAKVEVTVAPKWGAATDAAGKEI
jgi:DNA polymerase I-like protein with 3'-5' exonuclease and polymerase domains